MTLSDLPSYINSLLCWLIILRVIFWKRNGRRYKPAISLIAWILVISCSGIAVFYFLAITGLRIGMSCLFMLYYVSLFTVPLEMSLLC